EFASRESMAKGLARVSAFLEDPNLKGKVIPIGKVDEAKTPAAKYAGHNFPLINYNKAIQSLGSLTPEEKQVNELITSAARSQPDLSKVYVIAYVAGDGGTTSHEKHHAMFYF